MGQTIRKGRQSLDVGPEDSRFRSRIDEIADRHPEFAEHLRPFRDSLGRKTQRGAGFRSDPLNSVDDFFFDEPSFEEPRSRQPRHHNRYPEEKPSTSSSDTAEPCGSTENQPGAPPPEGDKPPPAQSKVYQSNTVDLGQPQSQVDDLKREQRSMSAPPDNRPPRFVSTLNIEPKQPSQQQQQQQENVNQPQQSQQSFPQQQQQHPQQQPYPQQQQHFQQKSPQQHSDDRRNPSGPGGPVTRIIPIQVEGRDDPVMPRDAEKIFGGETTTPGFAHGFKPDHPYYDPQHQRFPQGSPQQAYQQQRYRSPSPQPKQYGAHHPSNMQQPPQQQQQPQQPPQHHQQPPPPPQQQQQQQRQGVSPPRQQQPHPPPPPLDPIDKIKAIQKDVLELMERVEKFKGRSKDKEYIYLDEMLTRNLLKLDDIDTEGKENIRAARKEAIKCIQTCISLLEARAAAQTPQPTDKVPQFPPRGGSPSQQNGQQSEQQTQENKKQQGNQQMNSS